MAEERRTKIGQAAGVVYHELKKGDCNMTHLKNHLLENGYDNNTYMMALGWLARENKISIHKSINKWSISLR
ncbi:winged helix-turn-helix domain-containing protein [Methanohalophilus halophilus]|uniref:Winged helix-turn-helix domain n=1 Tax=Methanohalophilus halophilus TaxID=2177 RepID=A0A1L3Q4B6_9EURY|nr:winged helix-turn-helix domain-containing protein [Methanohalophilus halophilus]APH39727.1 hypothetical protein BHR79_09705 [Methanohalophilus halophilus]RNI08935.1 hypothetical protein EFE40_05555 [Methanohalophilus halophilus]SDW37622.1 Winged helix-turn-helix domain [Methanohalophilus halophilus]